MLFLLQVRNTLNPTFNLILLTISFFFLYACELGKSFLLFSAMKMAHAPHGHQSVIGRPSADGLDLPEYVFYRGEQVIEPQKADRIRNND